MLTLVVCGAPLAVRAGEVADALRERWSVSIVVTEAASQWYAEPSEHDRPRPDLVVACPLTFNTANKVAAGIMDTSAAGALCDALGAGVPVVAVPMVNNRLWGHPVWASTLRTLAGAGVRFVDPRSGRVGDPAPVQSGTGPEVVAAFDPAWVVAALG
ncbi:flavoprotein [Pseudonocardia sp. MH-G8]|uniref:flavoprotein n=1 Tax=Pseudonocardia sp. MH-G8 TaxID=1854588 RepID=UPI000B9FF9CA|nr:flavoprotein [Pseudonocardia sp. MH-G8]OZM79657.1 flavoprotein [Pseudonocardia sp. MH-G8]